MPGTVQPVCCSRINKQTMVGDAGEAHFSCVPTELLNFQSTEPRLQPQAVCITVWNGLLMTLQIVVGVGDADN